MSSATANPVDEPVDSPDVVRETAGVDRVVKLLEKYRDKLIQEIAKHEELPNNHADRNKLSFQTQPLQTAMEKLARYTSGLIENARIPEIDKIELQLHLAEMEGALAAARQTFFR